MATLKEAVSTLLKNGAKRVNNLVVTNVTVRTLESYTRIALTLDKPVKGYVADDDGNYSLSETNVIFVSLYSLNMAIRENEEMAFAVNEISEHPESLQILLSHAKIDVVQEDVVAGQVRTNPFNGKEDDATPDHDCIYNHVVAITSLSDKGMRGLEKIEDKILGLR